MVKYAIPCVFFPFCDEIVSLLALFALVCMAIYDFTKEALKE